MNINLNDNDFITQKKQELMELILAVRFSDLNKDQEACTELLDLSKKDGDLYGIAFAYAYLGDCFIGKNDSVNASSNLLRAKDLCEKNRFFDLLPQICNWLGIYYEMQNDRQMAVHHFLDALDFAEQNGDVFRQSILLNNVASQFNGCGSYEVAKEYYLKAFNLYMELENMDDSNPHYAQMTSNLISVCCRLGDLDDAQYFYSLMKASNLSSQNKNQLYLCELLIASSLEDLPATRASVDKLLVELEKQPPNLQQFFETFLLVAESMIGLEQEEYALSLLHLLEGLCPKEEYGHRLKVQYVWVIFYKKFKNEEALKAVFEEFYELRKLNDSILNKNLGAGLLSNIKLRESMKKNKEMQQNQKKLEDEIQIDELTQLFNRRSLREITEKVAIDPLIHSLSMIMIDVDYFKQYNDTYGHSLGDSALRAVADSLKSAANDNIFCFRYGGDEFVVICQNMASEAVEQYIQQLTEALSIRHIPHKASLCSNILSLSIGYSTHTRMKQQAFNISLLKDEADKALYMSKEKGRGCYTAYPSN